MTIYQAYTDFTAQSRCVDALMSMYAQLEREPERRIELTPIVVFIAFSIESYLNSVGARKIVIWDELERLPWRNKVRILFREAGLEPDWGSGPLQFAIEVFKLRDKLAHGKPERVVGPITKDVHEANELVRLDLLQPLWYQGITRDWVMDAKKQFTLLMEALSQLHGLHVSDHLHMATGGVLIDDEVDAESSVPSVPEH